MNSKVIMASVAVAVCSCTGMSEETSVVDEEMVVLDFDVPCQKLSRLSGTVEEDVVEDLQIFVFGMDGQLNAYGHSESDELTLTCSTGEKRVAALVNAPIVGSVTTETALKDLVSAFSDNSAGRFVMAGVESVTVAKSGKVTIPVSRLVSKVILSSIKNDFELEQHREMDFQIKSVFLTNAAKDRKYFSASSPSGWYNKDVADMTEIISQAGAMMYDSLGSAKVAYGSTFKSDRFLYCYPNALSAGAAPTYMVVEALLGKTLYYYPVALPAMEANKCYSVSLTVCRPGSSAPNIPVEKVDALFEVEVLPWSGNVSVNETI